MSKIVRVIGSINTFFGTVVGWVSLLMMAAIVYEVVARYVFNAPTIWSMEINQYLFCMISMLAGGYCLLKDGHVRVDIIYPRFSPKVKAWVEIITFLLPVAFCSLLIWQGGSEFWKVLTNGIVSDTVLEFPMWPVWLMIPLGGLLLALQILARYLEHIATLKGKE